MAVQRDFFSVWISNHEKTQRSVASESLIKRHKEGQFELGFTSVIQQRLQTLGTISLSGVYNWNKPELGLERAAHGKHWQVLPEAQVRFLGSETFFS